MSEYGANEKFLKTTTPVTPVAVEYINQNNLSNTYWAYNNNAAYKISDGSKPSAQAIVTDMTKPFDVTNVNYTVLQYLKSLYVFRTLNIKTVSVTKQQPGDYLLTYTLTNAKKSSKITLNIANSCYYSVTDKNNQEVQTSIEGELEIIKLGNTITSPLTIHSESPSC